MKPGDTYTVQIFSQLAEQGEDKAPKWSFRRRTIRESRALDKLDQRLEDGALFLTESEQADLMMDAVREYLVGDAPTDMEDLHLAELAELFTAMRLQNHLTIEQKKSANSSSTSDTENCALTAADSSPDALRATGSGTATTAQPATDETTNAPSATAPDNGLSQDAPLK